MDLFPYIFNLNKQYYKYFNTVRQSGVQEFQVYSSWPLPPTAGKLQNLSKSQLTHLQRRNKISKPHITGVL